MDKHEAFGTLDVEVVDVAVVDVVAVDIVVVDVVVVDVVVDVEGGIPREGISEMRARSSETYRR